MEITRRKLSFCDISILRSILDTPNPSFPPFALPYKKNCPACSAKTISCLGMIGSEKQEYRTFRKWSYAIPSQIGKMQQKNPKSRKDSLYCSLLQTRRIARLGFIVQGYIFLYFEHLSVQVRARTIIKSHLIVTNMLMTFLHCMSPIGRVT